MEYAILIAVIPVLFLPLCLFARFDSITILQLLVMFISCVFLNRILTANVFSIGNFLLPSLDWRFLKGSIGGMTEEIIRAAAISFCFRNAISEGKLINIAVIVGIFYGSAENWTDSWKIYSYIGVMAGDLFNGPLDVSVLPEVPWHTWFNFFILNYMRYPIHFALLFVSVYSLSSRRYFSFLLLLLLHGVINASLAFSRETVFGLSAADLLVVAMIVFCAAILILFPWVRHFMSEYRARVNNEPNVLPASR
jgi:hypothetical protein